MTRHLETREEPPRPTLPNPTSVITVIAAIDRLPLPHRLPAPQSTAAKSRRQPPTSASPSSVLDLDSKTPRQTPRSANKDHGFGDELGIKQRAITPGVTSRPTY
ncbi:hypothetical protein FALBO_11635 [Fusarium albosuccineum]|uniref:Uncharacterized protein n=1 Tax=Fusarium albosuccineum TaxID=1237068 RepID=A0A8H4P705_9HYPO|nr:hypothetical protein FALBO_11635 [Fusarium albosuccineum]